MLSASVITIALLPDSVAQHPNAVDCNLYLIMDTEREFIRGHNPRPSCQEAAMREALAPKQIIYQRLQFPFQLRQIRASTEGGFPFAEDF